MKKNKVMGKIIDYALNILIIIFAFLLLISIYTTFQIKVLKNDYANFFGYSLFEVQTGSMHGSIEVGDWIITKNKKDVKIGEIVTYKHGSEYITHRVMESYKGTFVTKGDANTAKDDPIDQSQIIGKVVKILHGFGLLRKTIFNPTVVVMLIITLYLFNLTFKDEPSEFDKKMKIFIKNLIKIIKRKFAKKTVKSEKINISKQEDNFNIEKEEIKEFFNNDKSIKIVKENTDESEIKLEKVDTEDELSKTSAFRVVSIKQDDSKNGQDKIEEKIEDVVVLNNDSSDLEKTMAFRIITINKTDEKITIEKLPEKQLSEKQEEIKKEGKKVIKLQAEDIKPKKIVEAISYDKVISERISSKKAKNIIEKTFLVKKIAYDLILDVILEKEKEYVKKSNFRDKYINEYIQNKYMSGFSCDSSKIIKEMQKFVNELKNKNKRDEKQLTIIIAYARAFEFILSIEDKYESVNIAAKMKKILNYNDAKAEEAALKVKNIFSISIDNLNEILKKLDTNTFKVKYNKISEHKNLYGVQLNHNISFNKVYSNYIVDKTYSEGVISEDKIIVLLKLIMCKISRDILRCSFDTKYLVYVPEGLYGKDKKLDRILSTINNEYAQSHIIILTTLTNMIANKNDILRLKKTGVNFAVIFNQELKLSTEDLGLVYASEYYFVDKSTIIDIEKFLPDKITNLTTVDNISDKIGDYRGE